MALSLGGSVYDPNDAVGRLLLNVLGMVAEFEADLIRLRTREGIGIARSKGKLKGKKPKLSPSQRKHLLTLHTAGEHTQAELAELFNVSRITISRVALHHGRHLAAPAPPLSNPRNPPPGHHIHSVVANQLSACSAGCTC